MKQHINRFLSSEKDFFPRSRWEPNLNIFQYQPKYRWFNGNANWGKQRFSLKKTKINALTPAPGKDKHPASVIGRYESLHGSLVATVDCVNADMQQFNNTRAWRLGTPRDGDVQSTFNHAQRCIPMFTHA